MTYTAWFDEIRKDDLALAGGKGANLGELSRAGLPVPLGFVVTTKAYEAFVESNEMGDTIVKLASMPDSEDPKAFEEASQKIHALFSGGKVPEKMAEEIRASYEKLDEDGGEPSPSVLRRPQRTWPGRASPVSRRPTSTCAEKKRCSMGSRTAGLLCGRRERWPTGHAGA
jgi:rifampicin phosphotransferase